MSTFGTFKDLSTQFEVGQGSEVLYGQFEVGQDSAELLGEADIQQLGSVELLGTFDAQGVADLLGNVEVQQSGSAELLGGFAAQDTADLLGKFETQAIADLLGKFEVGHDSLELLGKFESQAIAELLGDAIIKNSNYAELLGKADIGQDSAELLSKFEAQGVADLLGKFEAQGIADLLGKAMVAQGSAEFLGKGVVMGADSSDLKCIADIEHSADLLGKAVFGHPALPTWLKAIFSIRLTNAYRDLVSSLEVGRTTSAELLGKFEAQAIADLLSNAVIRHVGTPVELLGKAIIRHVGTPVELLGNAVIRGLSSADLEASVKIRPTAKDSDAYFSFWDPSDWINEVVGIGQGFIAIPWVEADSIVKTSGSSSARLTSVSGPGQYKEIRFGWGGMNWGFEAGVSPEVAPTPLDTDGRGPRRGSRASRDRRREVLTSNYNDLPARLFVTRQAFNDLAASFNIVTLSVSIIQLTTWAASVYATPAYASVLGVGFAGTLEAGDTYKFDWDAMVRSWVSDNDVCFRMTVTPDGEAKQVLGSEMKDDPPSGFMGPGLDGVCPVSLSRVFTAALDGNFTFNVEMKASSSADVFWQNLVVTLVKP